jgi:hypothetical protein
MKAPSISSACHGCAQKIACSDVDRRQMMQLLATGLATSLPFMATQVHAESTVHLLVDADALLVVVVSIYLSICVCIASYPVNAIHWWWIT